MKEIHIMRCHDETGNIVHLDLCSFCANLSEENIEEKCEFYSVYEDVTCPGFVKFCNQEERIRKLIEKN